MAAVLKGSVSNPGSAPATRSRKCGTCTSGGNGKHGQALIPKNAWFPIRNPTGDDAEAEMLRNEVTDGPADGLGKAMEQWAKGTCSLNDTSRIFPLFFLWEKAAKALYSDCRGKAAGALQGLINPGKC